MRPACYVPVDGSPSHAPHPFTQPFSCAVAETSSCELEVTGCGAAAGAVAARCAVAAWASVRQAAERQAVGMAAAVAVAAAAAAMGLSQDWCCCCCPGHSPQEPPKAYRTHRL